MFDRWAARLIEQNNKKVTSVHSNQIRHLNIKVQWQFKTPLILAYIMHLLPYCLVIDAWERWENERKQEEKKLNEARSSRYLAEIEKWQFFSKPLNEQLDMLLIISFLQVCKLNNPLVVATQAF